MGEPSRRGMEGEPSPRPMPGESRKAKAVLKANETRWWEMRPWSWCLAKGLLGQQNPSKPIKEMEDKKKRKKWKTNDHKDMKDVPHH